MSRYQRRLLVVESLEPRQLLAGVVQVTVLDGLLSAVGDDRANVFEIAQIVADDGAALLEITPDATTALNDLASGTPLRLAIDGLESIHIEPSGGNDSVHVQGLDIPGSLSIVNSAGDDEYAITESSFGKHLRIKTEGGVSAAELADLDIDGQLELRAEHNMMKASIQNMRLAIAIDESTPKLNLAAVMENIHVDATNVVANGSWEISYGEGGGAFGLNESTIAGQLTVDSSGPLDFELTGSSVQRGGYIKIGDIAGEAIIDGKVERINGSIRIAGANLGDLTVDSSGPLDFALTDSSVQRAGYIKIGDIKGEATAAAAGGGSIRIDRVSFGGLTVQSSGIPLDAYISKTDVTGDPATFRFSGDPWKRTLVIKEILKDGFAGGLDIEIEGTSPEIIIEDMVVRKRPGRIKYGDITLARELDKSTPILMQRTTFDAGLQIESNRPLDATLNEVRAASVDMFLKLGDIKGEAIVTDEGEASGGSVRISAGTLGDLAIDSSGPLDFALTDSNVRRGGYIKIGDIKGEAIVTDEGEASGGSIWIARTNLRGLAVETEGTSPEIIIEDMVVRKRPGRVKYGDITLARELDKSTPILMQRTTLDTGLQIESNRSLEAMLDRVPAARGDVLLKIGDIQGESIASAEGGGGGGGGRVAIHSSRMAGNLAVDSSGPLDFELIDSSVRRSADLKVDYNWGEAALDDGGGSGGGSIWIERSGLGDLAVQSSGPLDFELIDSNVRRSAYLKIDLNIKGEAALDDGGGSGGGSIWIERSSLGDLAVESSGPIDFELIDSNVRRSAYLKGKGDYSREAALADGGGGSIWIERSTLGDLAVQSNSPLDLELIDSDVRRGVYLKVDYNWGEAALADGSGSSIWIERSTLGDLAVESSGPLDFALLDSSVRRGGYIKIGDIKGEATLADGGGGSGGSIWIEGSSLRDLAVQSSGPLDFEFTDVQFHGDLTVLAGEGDDWMHVERLQVRGRTQIELGGGDDWLAAVDSVFHGFAKLDGGPGVDVLTGENVRFRGGVEFENWEEMDGITATSLPMPFRGRP